MRRTAGLGAGAAEPVAVEGGDGGFPVDPGVGMAVVAGAGVDVAGDEVGPGQPGVVGGDQLGGGGVAGEAGGMADQGAGQVAGAGGGRGHWSLTSAAAARAAASSAMVLRVAQVAMSAATASRFDRPRVAAGGVVDERGGVIAEKRIGAAGEAGVMLQVTGCLLQGHRLHGVADGDPLVERGEDAEFHVLPQLRLAGEHGRQRRGGIEVGIGEHPDGLQLVVDSRCASSTRSTGSRPRSAVSAASAAAACGMRVAWWNRGTPPSAVTTAWWIPREPTCGLGR